MVVMEVVGIIEYIKEIIKERRDKKKINIQNNSTDVQNQAKYVQENE